ncbi:hypothetical protein GCM10010218_05160 [Streptomyces mashuensis]|uniref:Uncharacterized protein n=1 Tax=Streptomyces mashuensis TaxID=33904 RepID=A0A919E9H6_9ACTN|nr:hypothetical protein GCM10010218_05160 [Streptomyces mashuensis]
MPAAGLVNRHSSAIRSSAKDPRHIKLAAVLAPLLRRTSPEGGGGFGGSYELRLSAEEAAELGGLLRAQPGCCGRKAQA